LTQGDDGAGSQNNKSRYIYKLDRSHLCIFLIDNNDGITDSVMICPLLSSKENHVECIAEKCAWFLKHKKKCCVPALAEKYVPVHPI
jgi:hypothetical protein